MAVHMHTHARTHAHKHTHTESLSLFSMLIYTQCETHKCLYSTLSPCKCTIIWQPATSQLKYTNYSNKTVTTIFGSTCTLTHGHTLHHTKHPSPHHIYPALPHTHPVRDGQTVSAVLSHLDEERFQDGTVGLQLFVRPVRLLQQGVDGRDRLHSHTQSVVIYLHCNTVWGAGTVQLLVCWGPYPAWLSIAGSILLWWESFH